MSLKRQRSPSPLAADVTLSQSGHDIWTSTKIEDRASIFVAYFSPTMPPRELQSQAGFKSASHRMLAWRTPGSQRTLVAKSRAIESGSDDDGENYGGKRALKVLNEMRVEGAVVVARWYGGVMLGPVRFNHIEDTVRDAVRAWQQNEESESQKRRKVEDEAKEKAALVSDLRERDQSIKVLRALLEEKTAAAAAHQAETPEKKKPIAAPAREIDYGSMTLDRLKQMDKARDSTVAFLLKRIDEVEQQQPPASVVKSIESQQNGGTKGQSPRTPQGTKIAESQVKQESTTSGVEKEQSTKTPVNQVKQDTTEERPTTPPPPKATDNLG